MESGDKASRNALDARFLAMRLSIHCASLAILLAATSLCASETKSTDARTDGFLGPIRSVSAREEKAQLEWHQPKNAPIIPGGVSCRECEYDRQGNLTRSGGLVDGEFRGDSYRLVKDENGKVIERVVENYRGEVYRREVLSLFGITLEEDFEDGILKSRRSWSYDGSGHLTYYFGYDQDGALVGSSERVTNARGNFKEEWDYGRDGSFSLHFVETTDPQKDTWSFTTFNENGSVKLALATQGTKVTSFWREPGEEYEFGTTLFMDPVGKTHESYHCHLGGGCDHIVSYFPDEQRHNGRREEWHDPAGVLQLAVDYEYEVDAFGNWTKRTLWLWTPELAERKLFETDYRTLKYWDVRPSPQP
jgi:hypothetical protein